MSEPSLSRLRWQCRRGMLELDLLLEAFLEQGYAALDARQRAVFEAFLRETDDRLQPWLFAGADPGRADYRELIAIIRAAVRR
jgi:antitoxin CptB